MKYEIKKGKTLGSMKLNEPHWIVYFEGSETEGPLNKAYPKLKDALEDFIDQIGIVEGIVKINIETLKK